MGQTRWDISGTRRTLNALSSETQPAHSRHLQGKLVQKASESFVCQQVNFLLILEELDIFLLKFIYKNKFQFETLDTKLWLNLVTVAAL